MPRGGDVVHVGPACSVQFAYGTDFTMRVIRWETSPSTPAGWIHLTGYPLDENGLGLDEARTVFVQVAGLRAQSAPPPVRRRAANRGPVRIPQQRTSTTARSNPR